MGGGVVVGGSVGLGVSVALGVWVGLGGSLGSTNVETTIVIVDPVGGVCPWSGLCWITVPSGSVVSLDSTTDGEKPASRIFCSASPRLRPTTSGTRSGPSE